MGGCSSAKIWARRWLICARSATSTGIMAGGASTVAMAATRRTNCGMRSKAISTCLMPPGPAIRTPEVSVTGVSRLRQIGACGHSGSLARQSEHAAAVVFNPKRRTIFLMVGNKAAEPQEVPAHGSSSLLNDQVRAPGSWGKEQEGRSRWLWLPDRAATVEGMEALRVLPPTHLIGA